MLLRRIDGKGTCAEIRVMKLGREVARLAKEESRLIPDRMMCRWKRRKDCRYMVVWQL